MTIIGSLPVNIANGTTEDAAQVMANFNYIVSQVNTNAVQASSNIAFTGNNSFSGTSVFNALVTPAAGIVGQNGTVTVAAGNVGEYITATSSPTVVANGVTTNLMSISLTAGDWDVQGNLFASTQAGGVLTDMTVGASSVSGTFAAIPLYSQIFGNSPISGPAFNTFPVPFQRFLLASTTTIYMVVRLDTNTNVTCTGILQARRRD
jgi:hypothetical protein